jgi:hypothetical protein
MWITLLQIIILVIMLLSFTYLRLIEQVFLYNDNFRNKIKTLYEKKNFKYIIFFCLLIVRSIYFLFNFVLILLILYLKEKY